MKSYLGLIPISARVRRRQNRMIFLCIVFSVFLVTAIFSVADMMIRTESDRMTEKHGSWHFEISGITSKDADEIAARDDVVSVGSCAIFNDGGELPYRINGKRFVLYGIDESYLAQNSSGVAAGSFPQGDNEIMLSENAAFILQADIYDTVTISTPAGDMAYSVTGLGGVDDDFYSSQYFLVDAYLPQSSFDALLEQNAVSDTARHYYIQFTTPAKAAMAIHELVERYGLDEGDISENIGVMGAAGHSNSEAMKNVYSLAGVLFVFVLLAGVLMISGGLNSNVAQRTQFFGMMRCIGMSKQQIARYVRLEALNWCKTAVPVGAALGTVISWGICAAMHYGIGGEFSTTPVFKISAVGIISGAAVGILSVLLAAQAPARCAARVSPVAAVSGSSEAQVSEPRAAGRGFGRIEILLGINHAASAKKKWMLMTMSFALSIVLALCFSVFLNFAELLLPSTSPWNPDFMLSGYINAQILPRSIAEELRANPGVRYVWGATGLTWIPAVSNQADIDHVTLCSYDEFMMESSKNVLAEGKMAQQDENFNEVMTIFNRNNPLRVGDSVQINGMELNISGAFSNGLFPDDTVIICPQPLFDQLVGEQDYNMVGILADNSSAEQVLAQLVNYTTDEIILSDLRETYRQDNATYFASRLLVYGFLLIIGLIAVFNIVNSISISVTARTKQYGAMRAVGMDRRQLFHMISAEAVVYALSGLIVGCVLGLWVNRLLYTRLITRYFGMAWQFPAVVLVVIVIFAVFAAAAAVYAPAKRICNMSITATINEL